MLKVTKRVEGLKFIHGGTQKSLHFYCCFCKLKWKYFCVLPCTTMISHHFVRSLPLHILMFQTRGLVRTNFETNIFRWLSLHCDIFCLINNFPSCSEIFSYKQPSWIPTNMMMSTVNQTYLEKAKLTNFFSFFSVMILPRRRLKSNWRFLKRLVCYVNPVNSLTFQVELMRK